jgi:dTDP-L-rhamnose 4-epimerase
MLILEKEETNYEVFNVGSGKATTVLEYTKKLSSKLGKEIKPLIPGEFRLGDNRHSVSSIEKIGNLRWAPKRSLDDIFVDYIHWLESMGDVSLYFSEAEKNMRASGVILPTGHQRCNSITR